MNTNKYWKVKIMIGRRTAAYVIDLLIFLGSTVLAIILGSIITNSFIESLIVQVIITVPLTLIFLLITSGIMGVLLRGSIGKKLMDLKISSTMGFVTAFRLLARDVAKYFAYIPVLLGVYMLFDNRIEHMDFFVQTAKVTAGLLVLVISVQAYVGFTKKQMFADYMFFTKVENDIPTAVEYDDLLEFIEGKEKVKK